MVFIQQLVPQILGAESRQGPAQAYQSATNVTFAIATGLIGLNYLVVSVLIGD